MDANLIAIEQTLQLFASVGKAAIDIIKLKQSQNKGQSKASEADSKVDVRVTFGLDVRLENLIRELLSRDPNSSREEPRDYWIQATRGLIGSQEPKFEELVRLDLAPIAIGTEAMMMRHVGDTHEHMIEIAAQYLQTYALSGDGETFDYPALPPPPTSTFARALDRVRNDLRDSERPSMKELSDAYGPIRLDFGGPKADK